MNYTNYNIKKVCAFATVCICAFFITINPVIGQQINSQADIEEVLFDDTVDNLQSAIEKAGRNQSIYAYNIANMSTPEFVPFLPKKDRELLIKTFPKGNYTRETLLEFILTKMSENRSKYNAYISIQRKKFEIIRQVSTLGKK
jgi:hypothetical protein